MSVAQGYEKIPTNGLVFMYDVADSTSYKGEPTTNYIYHQNARIDSTYESYMPEAGAGTITANHPGAIRVYNTDSTDISNYINGGVGDYTNQRHAYWIFDNYLRRPVVRMYNENGSWQAKHFNPGIGSLTNIGVTAGTQYTLSWLQYVESLDRSAWVGFYSYSNTNGYNNFWDGLQASYNTKTYTWERVYATFTAQNNGQLGNYHNGYIYGHAIGAGELRIADVQLEVKTHATQYSSTYTRLATEALRPLAGNATLDLANVSFDSNAKITFDGTNDCIIVPTSDFNKTDGQPLTVEVIMKPERNAGQYQDIVVNRSDSQYNWMLYQHATDGSIQLHGVAQYKSTYIPTIGQYIHVVATVTSGQVYTLYVNGNVQQVVSGYNYNGSSPSLLCIGVFGTSKYEPYLGNIDIAKIYNQALTQEEVRQSYNKYKTRFNLS
jgi:hypothetical protein